MALQTASATSRPTIPAHIPTLTPTPFPTLTPSPLPENPILISRVFFGGDGVDEITSCLHNNGYYSLVLYKDGHLITFDGIYNETVIPNKKIEKLLSDIKATGFYELQGNGDQYGKDAPTPPAQHYGTETLTINGKNITFEDTMYAYEAESIKKTRQLISNFVPSNMEPYQPDHLLLWVMPVDNPSFDNYQPKPYPPLLHWQADAIALNTFGFPSNLISHREVKFIMQQIKAIPDYRMVEQDKQYYLVAICPDFQ